MASDILADTTVEKRQRRKMPKLRAENVGKKAAAADPSAAELERTAATAATSEPVSGSGDDKQEGEEDEAQMMKKLVDLSLNGTSGSPKKSAPAQPDSVAKVAQTGFMKDFRAGAELHGQLSGVLQ